MGDQVPEGVPTFAEMSARYTAIRRQEKRDVEELKRRVHRAFTPEQRAVVADILELVLGVRPFSTHAMTQTIAMFRE